MSELSALTDDELFVKATENRWSAEMRVAIRAELRRRLSEKDAEIAALRKERDEATTAAESLLSWAERFHAGDSTLHSEEWYVARDFARAALSASEPAASTEGGQDARHLADCQLADDSDEYLRTTGGDQ